MGKYIKNNRLRLGKSESTFTRNLEKLMNYIYEQFPLDHDNMKQLYEHVRVPVNFDDTEYEDNEKSNSYYRSALKFTCHYDKDDKYIYSFNNEFDSECYNNDPFIIELHEYLLSKTPQELRIGRVELLYLTNDRGVNEDARGVRSLDWKLHFWNKYDVSKDEGITLDDLIIACYKIRSHKFENDYELFTGIKKAGYGNGVLYGFCRFEHGS